MDKGATNVGHWSLVHGAGPINPIISGSPITRPQCHHIRRPGIRQKANLHPMILNRGRRKTMLYLHTWVNRQAHLRLVRAKSLLHRHTASNLRGIKPYPLLSSIKKCDSTDPIYQKIQLVNLQRMSSPTSTVPAGYQTL